MGKCAPGKRKTALPHVGKQNLMGKCGMMIQESSIRSAALETLSTSAGPGFINPKMSDLQPVTPEFPIRVDTLGCVLLYLKL